MNTTLVATKACPKEGIPHDLRDDLKEAKAKLDVVRDGFVVFCAGDYRFIMKQFDYKKVVRVHMDTYLSDLLEFLFDTGIHFDLPPSKKTLARREHQTA